MKTINYKKNSDAKGGLMNARVKKVLVLFLFVATLFCLLSCSQTLPTQATVVIKRINSDNFTDEIRVDQIDSTSWSDADSLDGNAKVTAFIGAKFSRTIPERSFTVLSADGKFRLLYKFDGKTYSDSDVLNHPGNSNSGQKPYTGVVSGGGSEFTLYAYYTYETYEVKAVELSGKISQKRFTTIPDNAPLTLTMKLNFGRTFNPGTIQAGTAVPDEANELGAWIFPKIKGLEYSISSISTDYTSVTIAVKGTPLERTPEPLSDISIPSGYINDVVLPLTGENSEIYAITDPTINVSNQIISGSKYKEIKKGEQKLVFNIQDGASFNTDELKVGDSLKDYEGFSINYIDGLEYEISSINEGTLEVSVYGHPATKVPFDDGTNDGYLNFSRIKEKYIKYGTGEDVIENTSEYQPLQSEGSKYEISDIAVELSTSDGSDSLNIVNNITIPENESKVISLKITSGAKFKKEAVAQNESVEWSSFVSIGEVQGLNFKFGSLEDRDDGSLLNIIVYGTAQFMTKGDTPIVVSIPTSAIEGAPDSESVRVGTIKFVRNFVELEVAPYSENVKNYGTEEDPLRGTSNILLGGGEGVRVHLILKNATFNGSIENYLKECFSALQKEFGYSVDSTTYSLITGGGKDEGDVIVLIKGAPINLKKVSTPKAVSITLPKEVITNGSEGLTDASANLYYITSDGADIEVDNTSPYEGTYDFPLKATRSYLIGTTDDKEEVSIKLNLKNAEFREDIKKEDIKEWFENLHTGNNCWGSDLSYSIKDRKNGIDDSGNTISSLIIKIDGTPTSFNTSPVGVDVVIPRSAIKGSTDEQGDLITSVYYQINGEVSASVVNGDGTEDNPIKGTQYVLLGKNGEGVIIDIRLYGGKFDKIEPNNTDVSSWFKNWVDDAFDTPSDSNKPAFTVVSLSEAKDVVTIRINGSIRKAAKEDETGAKITDRVKLTIPKEYIKDSKDKQFSDNLSATLYYVADASMGVEFSSEELYYGTSSAPLFGVRGVSMNDGNGVDVKLNITNGGTFSVDVDEEGDTGVETWFSSFGESEIKEPKYTIVRGGKKGDNYIVVHISGILRSETGVLKSTPITLNKALFNGSLINDPITTLYYKVTSDVKAEVDTSAAYFGSESNPLTSVRYVRLGTSGDGEEIKIALTNAKFDKTLKVGQSVSEWFTSLSDITGITSFTISEISPEGDYVVVKIKGALTSDVKGELDESDTATISIPSYLIDGYLSSNVEATLYYKTTAEVNASIYSGSGYYGSLQNPIVDAQRVALNNGNGVRVRINLDNAVFNATVNENTDFSKWFESFNELINKEITFIAGGEGQNFVALLLKGSLTTTSKQTKTINVKVPSSAVSGYLPQDLALPLYYYITNKVTATFDSSGDYKGSSDAPIEGIRYVPLGENGSGVEMKVSLDGAKFREDLSNDDILKWFISFSRLTGREVEIKDRGDLTYIIFVMKGTLTVPEGEDEGESEARIPVSDIQSADFNDDIVLSVNYRISGKVTAVLDENGEYLGSENKPITDVQNRPFNDGNGYFVKINLENGTFKQDVLKGVSEVSSWFTNFVELKQTTYELYDVGEKFVVVRIKGAITSSGKSSKKISIPSSVIVGSLEANVETDMWFESTSAIDIRLDSRDIYYGADNEHKITGTRYIDISSNGDVLVRINLIGAKFAESIDKDYDFSSWFTALSDYLVGPSNINERYTLHDGGANKDYVVISIKGALKTSDLFDNEPVDVRVPRDAINAPTLDKEELTAKIYSGTNSEIFAKLDEGGDYYGSSTNPLTEDKFVYLNQGDGVLIKIMLSSGATFKETVKKYSDDPTSANVARWFGEFTNNALTPDTTYIVEDIASDRTFVVVRVKGAIISSLNGNINISNTDIDGYLNNVVPCKMNVEVKEDVTLTLENASEYSGTNEHKLTGKANIMLGDGEGVLIRINLSKGVFASFVKDTYDISSWFENLSRLMTEPTYEIVSGGSGESFVVVRIKGAFLSEGDGSVSINIPSSDLATYYSDSEVKVSGDNIYYNIEDSVEVVVSSEGRYTGSGTNPIRGTQYVELNSGKGVEVKVSVNNGSFNALSDEKVKGWFSSSDDNNIDSKLNGSDYRIIEGGKDGDSFVVVRIKGAFNVVETTSAVLKVPMEDVKNSREKSGYNNEVIHYSVDNVVNASLKNIQGYYGTESNPIKGLKNIPFNNGDGYLIYISLNGSTTFKSDIVSGATVDSWFDDFKNIITYAKYEIIEGGSGKDYIVIKVTGELALGSDTLLFSNSGAIKIPANALEGTFDPNFVVPVQMYYNQEGEIVAELETTGYVGSDENPIESVPYVPLYTGNEEGVRIKVNLVAKDREDRRIETMGALFSDRLGSDVSSWFKSFTDFVSAPYYSGSQYDDKRSFEIIDGGAGYDYAVILMKGAITTSSDYSITIPTSDILGHLTSSVSTLLSYTVEDYRVGATVDNTGIYYGGESTPVSGYQYIPLNDGKGQKIRIILSDGVKFRKGTGLKQGGSEPVSGWFENFKALENGEYTVESGGEGENYIIITLKGYLSISTEESATVEVNVPSYLIEANIPQNLSADLYYKSSGGVKAHLVSTSGRYYGGEELPISGVSYSALQNDNGNPLQMRIVLVGAKFKGVDADTDFSTWFDEWSEIEALSTSQPIFNYKAGGTGEEYVVLEVQGKLTATTTETKRVRIKVPSDNISGALSQDVYTNLCYKVKSSIRASVDMTGAYRGSYLYPLTGSSGLEFSNANRYIRISLENTTFASGLTNAEITKWFSYTPSSSSPLVSPSSVIDTSNGGYRIASHGGEGDSDIIVEITGGFKYDTPATEKGYLDIRIPKEHINASLNEDYIYLSLYYTCLGKVTITLSSDELFVGADDANALEGIVGVDLNNGSGTLLRINLSNDAVFNSNIGSFNSFGTIKDYVDSFSVAQNSGSGGAEASYVDFVITGKPKNVRHGTAENQSTTSVIEIPYSNIKGYLSSNSNEKITVSMNYIFYPTSALSLSVSTNPTYYGYASNPLTFIPYIAFGEGNGVDAKLDITLNRSGRVSNDKFTPVFNSAMTDEHLKEMFKPLFDGLLGSGTYSVAIVEGGPSSSSLTVRFTGFVTSENSNNSATISAKNCIAGGSEDLSLSTTMYIRTSQNPSVSLQEKTSGTLWDWFGTYDAPITGPRGSSLYNMNARLILSSGLTFSKNLNNTTLGERIKGVLYDQYEVDTGVVITRGGAGYNFVEFRVDSTTPSSDQDVTKTSGDIVLTYDLISGAVSQIGDKVRVPIYYSTNGTVSIGVVQTKCGESRNNPVSIVNYVNLGEGEGVKTVLEFKNVHLNQFKVGGDVTSWFENMMATIEVQDLTFTVIPVGSDIVYEGKTYPGAGYPVSGMSVTTGDNAVGYTYDTSSNTYNSYIGIWIQGASGNLQTLGSAQQVFQVPITDTNDSRVRTESSITGRMFIERINIVFSVTGVNSHYNDSSSKVLIGSRNIYLGYGENTGVDIAISIQNGHFADTISNDEFIAAFKAMVNGVYNMDDNGIVINSDKTSATITLKGYPTSATFTSADDQIATTYNMFMLVKWVKGGSTQYPNETIHEMPFSLSIGVPQIRSGSLNTIRGFAGMVMPSNYQNRTTSVDIYGNAKFNNSATVTLNQTNLYAVNKHRNEVTIANLYDSAGSAFEFTLKPSREMTSNTYKRIDIVMNSSVGEHRYFNNSIQDFNVRVDLSLSDNLLEGSAPGVSIQNNGAYITFEILDPDYSSYISADFDEAVQSTPKGQDRVFYTYYRMSAPTWYNLGFSLQDDLFALTKDWEKIGNAGTAIKFWEIIKFARPVTTSSEGRLSYVAALRGYGRDDDYSDINDAQTVKIRCVDVQTWDMNAHNDYFYLVLNDNSTNGPLRYNEKWGIPGWSSDDGNFIDNNFYPTPVTPSHLCTHKDDGRADFYNKSADLNWIWSKSN